MIEFAPHKDGIYALGNGGTIEVVAGEVIQVEANCPFAQGEKFGEVLSREAKALRAPSNRTAPRYVTSAVVAKRHAALRARGVDPVLVLTDEREIVIPSVTREEWDAQNAPAPTPEPENPPAPEGDTSAPPPEAPPEDDLQPVVEPPTADDSAGASSASVRKAVSKGKGSAATS